MRDRTSTLPIVCDAVGFAAGDTCILRDVTLKLDAGPPTVLIGPNGSGKTTLIKLAVGLLAPTAGSIRYAQADRSARRQAIVFQKPVMLRRSAGSNVAYALKAAGRAADAANIIKQLDRVGLAHLADRPARRLSGGEQQRLALARALARDPDGGVPLPVGRPDFKSGWGRQTVSGGFDSHPPPPNHSEGHA